LRTKWYLVGRCDLELDTGTKMGRGRPKNKSSHNGLKTDVSVGLFDMNPVKHEWTQVNSIREIYHDLFISSNMEKTMVILQSVQC
jgi:hypothetical protein